ncbi:MAG: universal stress protein [Bacteroidota bacterium]
MRPVRTVVAAVDLSPGSEAALVRAATLAARAEAALHVVHADETPSDGLRRALGDFVDTALGLGTADSDASVRLAVVQGRTVPAAVIQYGRDVDTDVLITGTRGKSGVDRLLVGSVAEALVASAPWPVLTVPTCAEAHEPSPEAPVLVAVDFDGLAEAALRAGRALADLHGAPLELVHVVRERGPYLGLSRRALSLNEVEPEWAAEVRQRLSRLSPLSDLHADAVHVSLGASSRQVTAVADAVDAGAIVLATHGRRGVAHAMLGSTAEATLRRARCAVLTVHAGTVGKPGTVRRSAIAA